MHIHIDQNPNIELDCKHGTTAPMISLPVIQHFANMNDQMITTWAEQLGEGAVHKCGNDLYIPAHRILWFLVIKNQPPMDPQQALEMLSVKAAKYIIPFVELYTPKATLQSTRDMIAFDAALNEPNFGSEYDISIPLTYMFETMYQPNEEPSRFNFSSANIGQNSNDQNATEEVK